MTAHEAARVVAPAHPHPYHGPDAGFVLCACGHVAVAFTTGEMWAAHRAHLADPRPLAVHVRPDRMGPGLDHEIEDARRQLAAAHRDDRLARHP